MTIIDGIYFAMPEDVYHAVPRLSASGLQKLLVSAATFWAGSWLNPKRAALLAATAMLSVSGYAAPVASGLAAIHGGALPDASDKAEKETDARKVGRAYHAARLEPEKFAATYVRELDKGDMPKGTLFTGKDMEKALADMGQPKSGSVAEQAQRLLLAGYPGTIWHAELAIWEEERGDRIGLSPDTFDEIAEDMALIAASEVAPILTGGEAEVSVFWTDGNGIQWKARLDYLRPDAWVDFKTFANANGKHLEQAISDAFIYNRYHVQAALYRHAVELIRTGELSVIDGDERQRELVEAIQLAGGELAAWYVFQEKGGIPNLLAKRLRFHEVPDSITRQSAGASDEARRRVEDATRTPQAWFVRANREISKATRLYAGYQEIYAPGEKWRPFNPLGEMDDQSFRSFWLDEDLSA